ncbi:unnamed protein product [Clonostachys chloroleuca]|uniref:Brl1/Brr6 domain-containing protein n=1 Tax=Clonostachys chloroleuca TaxID=1926264 RepID=A0AA35LXH9_9HYPO|nr:unnamed protein product [Clonostachys chloroleuca]
MNPRSFEGPMDWEYQDKGPFDPTSPFTHAAKSGNLQNGFGSPIRNNASSRPNPFATPSKSHQAVAQQTSFSSNASMKPAAPPFRNPAFTTPRKPINDFGFSDASGAEESPGLTEASDINDTPEFDRTADVHMGNTIPPTKIDKSLRYGKALSSSRKHVSGRGEIPSRHHDLGRRLRRQNQEGFPRLRPREWEGSEDESDASSAPSRRSHSPKKKAKAPPPQSPGFVSSLFYMMDEHSSAPENLYRWIQLSVNVFMISMVCYAIWAIINTVSSDIHFANEVEKRNLESSIDACRLDYIENGCTTTNAPKLKPLCDEWYKCMTQDPAGISRVKVSMKQLAEIINEFFDAMNFKALGAVSVVVLLTIFANNAAYSRAVASKPAHPTTKESQTPNPHPSMVPDSTPGVMWVPVQTPSSRRHALLEEETDTDSSPPKAQQFLLQAHTPSSNRVFGKRGRSVSPIKYGRSPSKGY